jgi:ferritin
MLDAKIESALNEQINHELASAYLYLSMAAHFEAGNLPGSAKWMRADRRRRSRHTR